PFPYPTRFRSRLVEVDDGVEDPAGADLGVDPLPYRLARVGVAAVAAERHEGGADDLQAAGVGPVDEGAQAAEDPVGVAGAGVAQDVVDAEVDDDGADVGAVEDVAAEAVEAAGVLGRAAEAVGEDA